MALDFIGRVTQRRDGCVVDSEIAVFQQLEAGNRNYVALVGDSCDYSDHRITKISYSEGELLFTATYDGPLRNYQTDYFVDGNKRRVVELFSFLKKDSDTESNLLVQGHALVYDKCFYQIVSDKNPERNSQRITVYDSEPVQRDGALCYPVLAVITFPKRNNGIWEYGCHIGHDLPIPLCMAIISLPFIVC